MGKEMNAERGRKSKTGGEMKYFVWDCSDLGDCLATNEVGNLMRNVMAPGLNMSSVTPLFLELWPIKIKNKVIICIFSILHGLVQTWEVANLKINIFTTSKQKFGNYGP